MFAIEDKVPLWQGDKKALGEDVHARIIKHLDKILLAAYQSLDPTTTHVAPEAGKCRGSCQG